MNYEKKNLWICSKYTLYTKFKSICTRVWAAEHCTNDKQQPSFQNLIDSRDLPWSDEIKKLSKGTWRERRRRGIYHKTIRKNVQIQLGYLGIAMPVHTKVSPWVYRAINCIVYQIKDIFFFNGESLKFVIRNISKPITLLLTKDKILSFFNFKSNEIFICHVSQRFIDKNLMYYLLVVYHNMQKYYLTFLNIPPPPIVTCLHQIIKWKLWGVVGQ